MHTSPITRKGSRVRITRLPFAIGSLFFAFLLGNRENLVPGIEIRYLRAVNMLAAFYPVGTVFGFIQFCPVTGHQHHIILRFRSACSSIICTAAEQLFASLIVFLAFPEHQYKILRFILAGSTNAAKGRKENGVGSVDRPLGTNCDHSFL